LGITGLWGEKRCAEFIEVFTLSILTKIHKLIKVKGAPVGKTISLMTFIKF